jgi:hypothetical protein
MHHNRIAITILVIVVALLLAGCTPPPESCIMTANTSVTAYRLPDTSSDVFGTMPSGESFEVLARTADGWLGFDPGVAQAANIGLARHRWVLMNVSLPTSCLDAVELVTLAHVEADVDLSNQ